MYVSNIEFIHNRMALNEINDQNGKFRLKNCNQPFAESMLIGTVALNTVAYL